MKGWKLLTSQVIVNSPWLQVYRNSYHLPGGQEIEDYYVVERSDFVIVVACDEVEVVLVRQYRPATDQMYLALPAGYIQESESPETAARRELSEETGLHVASCSLIGELHPLPGYIKSCAYVVLCGGLAGELKAEDQLEIDIALKLPWKKTLEMIQAGEIREMQAVSALLLAWQFINRSQLGL